MIEGGAIATIVLFLTRSIHYKRYVLRYTLTARKVKNVWVSYPQVLWKTG